MTIGTIPVTPETSLRIGAPATVPLSAAPVLPRPFLWLIDAGCLIGSFYSAYFLAPRLKLALLAPESPVSQFVVEYLAPQIGEYRRMPEVAWMLFLMWGATVLALQGTGGYRPLLSQSRTRLVATAFLAPCLGLSAITLVLFALREPGWSRLFVFLFTACSAVSLVVTRGGVRAYRARRRAAGAYARTVAFVGSPAAVRWLRLFFEKTVSPQDYRVVGWFSIPGTALSPFANQETLPCLGDVDQLGEALVHRPIHQVIAIQGMAAGEWLTELISVCDYFRITLRIVPEALLTGKLRDLQIRYHTDPLRLPEVVLSPRTLDSGALFVKRVLDIVLSAFALLVLAPVFALIALVIKATTPGLPVFYRWRVVGYNGTPFTGYKFTTMTKDADARRHELLSLNEMQGPVFKIKDDPRVTPIGGFLRKFSINELPQLWSVLKGDMSLVGPRPAFPHELERYELWQKRKLCIKPGITCLWQVRGRNKISSFDDWVRMDLEYIDHWSLWLDLKILARTLWVVVCGSGS